MKRVRFSLRLVLLVVALVAVCVATWRAKMDERHFEWQNETIDHKTYREHLVQRRVELVEILKHPGEFSLDDRQRAQRELQRADAELTKLRTKIEGTEPFHVGK